MDHIGTGFMPLDGRRYRGFLSGYTKVPFLKLEDLGSTVAHVLSRREDYLNRTVELAGDLVSATQITASCCRFSRGRLFTYRAFPAWYLRLFNNRDFRVRKYFERYSRPDSLLLMKKAVTASKTEFPFLTSVRDFLDARYSGHPR